MKYSWRSEILQNEDLKNKWRNEPHGLHPWGIYTLTDSRESLHKNTYPVIDKC